MYLTKSENTIYLQLQAFSKRHQVFIDMEMPLIPVLIRMERHGVKIDVTQLHKHSAELAKSLQVLEKQAHEWRAANLI